LECRIYIITRLKYGGKMSKKDSIEPEKVDYDEKKVEKARARKHKAKPLDFVFIGLLLVAVAVSIFIIENYQ
jgi:hypothetical protein